VNKLVSHIMRHASSVTLLGAGACHCTVCAKRSAQLNALHAWGLLGRQCVLGVAPLSTFECSAELT
jgi:hypothetical protein